MLWSIVLTSLIVAALLVRVVHLEQSLLTFHPTRQYRSAIIARACYYDVAPAIPDWARSVAVANRAMQPVGEPPLMEWLACVGYQTTRSGAYLRFGRALAAIFWVIGVIPLVAVIRRFASAQAALVGASVYLFLPYGIVASRAFQPDRADDMLFVVGDSGAGPTSRTADALRACCSRRQPSASRPWSNQ